MAGINAPVTNTKMKVVNIHERVLDGSVDEVGRLIDTLASPNDLLWPIDRWVPMKFDRPLCVGAVGGHGPSGTPSNLINPVAQFVFASPNRRALTALMVSRRSRPLKDRPILRHIIEMQAVGRAFFTWIVIRPLHDALMEDALDHAEASLGKQVPERKWSCWVKVVRWIIRRRQQPPRATPASS